MSISDELKTLIKRPKMRVFRRLSIRRRIAATGDYESDWVAIDNRLIKKYGTVSRGMSNMKANFYKYSGMTFEFNNEGGIFNDVTDDSSIFYNFLSVYRTLVRVEAGYLDDSDVEHPTNSVIYFGYVGEDIVRTDKNVFRMPTHHISKVFDEFPADQVKGLGAAQKAYQIIEKVRDHKDTLGVPIFQKYISSTAWNIESTTTDYNIATSTALQGKTVWKLLQKLAEAESKLLYIDPNGQFRFESTAVETSSVWHFSGPQDEDQSFGKNIISVLKLGENLKNIYNRVMVKFGDANTSTSYKIRTESWNWGDSSSSFKYGIRTYKYKNEFLNSATANTVADTIYDRYVLPLREARFKSKFLPGLDISDTVDVTHNTGEVLENAAYGKGLYGEGIYGKYIPGSVNLAGTKFLVTNIKDDIEKFTTEVTLEEP